LFRQDHSFAQWNYTFCMPELTSPMILFDADWSGRLHNDNSDRLNFPQQFPFSMESKEESEVKLPENPHLFPNSKPLKHQNSDTDRKIPKRSANNQAID